VTPDKRKQTRHQTRVFCVFKNDINLDETEVLMLNMTSGGAFIKSDNPAPPGTPITLRIYLDPDGEPMSVSAEVVWWKALEQPGEGGMGVKFARIDEEDLEAIKEYLANLISEDLFN